MDIATAIQNYWWEFVGWAATFGFQVDPNPMDSPLFRQFLQAMHPALYAQLMGQGGTGQNPPPPVSTPKSMSTATFLLAVVAAAVALWPKRRRAS